MSHSLASLTATYTDSEGEDEEDPGHLEAGTVTLTEESSLSKPPSPIQPTGRPKKRRAHLNRLVSYQDENNVSTEGEDTENEYTDEDGEGVGFEQPSEVENAMGSPAKKEVRRPIPTDVELPEEAKGKCSAEHQERVMKHFEKVQKGLDMNSMIQRRKDFRNPSIYEKLILYCNINELGTNYPPHMYDPTRWGKDSFYEELAKVQKVEMDKKEKEKKEKAKVEIVTGTARKPPTLLLSGGAIGQKTSAALATAAATAATIEEKRKSKWDQVGTAALTANVTGTKSTVISAFGSLPKRPKL
ncbi:SAP30-binding protein [Neocloeon triangulifer]|uniref:SAP30-binding protein n=1 Tax=Neocloeon triangulifer TaxID=2078957 RepID=UPI00286F6AC1|nr:SAP30-binding protein [Neocloeon triangulifer]